MKNLNLLSLPPSEELSVFDDPRTIFVEDEEGGLQLIMT